MPCSCSGIKMIIWRVGLRTLETPTPHPRIVFGTHHKSCHYPQHVRSFTKNRNLEIGSTMFMVWVSFVEQVRCSTTPQSEQTIRRRQFVHKQSSFTPLLFHDSSPKNVSQRSFPHTTVHRKRPHGTQKHAPIAVISQPLRAYRSFWKNRQWAIGSQAFKALMFILGVGNNNRCDRSRIAQSEQYMRRRRVPPQRDGPRKHRHHVSNQWLPSMPRSCDGTIVKTTMTCHLSNLLTDGPHVLRSILTIA